MENINIKIWYEVRPHVREQMVDQISDSVRDQVWNNVFQHVMIPVFAQTLCLVEDEVKNQP